MSGPHDIFDTWYTDGNGSGPGSSPEATEEWRAILTTHLANLPPGSVVLDWGCGDWDHSKLVDWGEHEYIGVDVSPTVIDRMNRQYATELVTFHRYDPDSGEDPTSFLSRVCPQADLIICKDVLQHLSNAESLQILEAFRSIGGDLLLTNDLCGGPDDNADGPTGGCRHVDPRLPPFSLEAELLLRKSDGKTTFLIRKE